MVPSDCPSTPTLMRRDRAKKGLCKPSPRTIHLHSLSFHCTLKLTTGASADLALSGQLAGGAEFTVCGAQTRLTLTVFTWEYQVRAQVWKGWCLPWKCQVSWWHRCPGRKGPLQGQKGTDGEQAMCRCPNHSFLFRRQNRNNSSFNSLS